MEEDERFQKWLETSWPRYQPKHIRVMHLTIDKDDFYFFIALFFITIEGLSCIWGRATLTSEVGEEA